MPQIDHLSRILSAVCFLLHSLPVSIKVVAEATAKDELQQSIIAAVLTAVTLLSFQFTQRKPQNSATPAQPSLLRSGIAQSGKIILTITFGYLFAATLNTSLLLFSDRAGFFISTLGQIFDFLGGGS